MEITLSYITARNWLGWKPWSSSDFVLGGAFYLGLDPNFLA